MFKFVSALALGAGLLTATSVSAQTTVEIQTSNNSLGVQNDIVLDFTGEYTGSQLLLELDAGTAAIAATGALPLGGETSFLSLGGDSVVNSPSPNIGGGAIDIEGNAANSDPVFSATLINQAWAVAGGGSVVGAQDFLNARITLSPDAQGTFSFLTSVSGDFVTTSGNVVDGALVVPEPTTAGLLGLAGLSLIARRRKVA